MKTALARLFVAVLFVLTSALNLVGALLKLLATSLVWLTARIPTRAQAPAKALAEASSAAVGETPSKGSRPNLRIVAGAPSKADQLQSGLTNMGFESPRVRAFVVGLGGRVETEPMADLIKEGLRALASRVA